MLFRFGKGTVEANLDGYNGGECPFCKGRVGVTLSCNPKQAEGWCECGVWRIPYNKTLTGEHWKWSKGGA